MLCRDIPRLADVISLLSHGKPFVGFVGGPSSKNTPYRASRSLAYFAHSRVDPGTYHMATVENRNCDQAGGSAEGGVAQGLEDAGAGGNHTHRLPAEGHGARGARRGSASIIKIGQKAGVCFLTLNVCRRIIKSYLQGPPRVGD